jgi:hypothetical protein
MGEEIKQVVTVDAAEAIRKLNELTGVEHKLAGATDVAAEAGKRQAKAADQGGFSMKALAQNIASTIGGMMGFTSAAGGVVMWLKAMADAADEAFKSVAKLGNQMRALVNEVGAKQAGELKAGAEQIAKEMGTGVEGRTRLMQTAQEIAEKRPGQTTEQIMATMRSVATFEKATAGKGDFSTLFALQKRLGLTEQQAVDTGTQLLNGPFEKDTLQQVLQKTGEAPGGMDFMALLSASSKQGLDVGRAQRQIPSLMSAITTKDEHGRLGRELQMAGITDQTGLADRMRMLIEAKNSGKLTQSQFEKAIGGADSAAIFAGPMERALAAPGGLDAARADLTAPGAAAAKIAEQQKSPEIRTAEELARQELRKQQAKETPAAASVGEKLGEARTRVAEQSFGSELLGYSTESVKQGVGVALPGVGLLANLVQTAGTVVHYSRETHNYDKNPKTDVRVPENP